MIVIKNKRKRRLFVMKKVTTTFVYSSCLVSKTYTDVKFYLVLDFTVKDSDMEEEKEVIPDRDEEGNYYLCVLRCLVSNT